MENQTFIIEDELKKLPGKPGVYLMHGEKDEIIYVGKAISLKNRVRQYFQPSRNRGAKIDQMVTHITRFEYIVTDSELEALVLECNLIKEHRPKYNTMLMDDKSYPFIKVTTGEAYPRIMMARQMKKDKSKYFGPYTSVTAVKDTIELIRKLYRLRSCNRILPRDIGKERCCLYHHIKQCDAPCQGYISQEKYRESVDEVLKFLGGNYDKILKDLEKKMQEASDDLEFEKAIEYRELLHSVKQIAQKQKITDTGGEDRDIVALAREHEDAVVQVFFIRNGRLIGRDHFYLRIAQGDENAEILSSFIKQFYAGTPYIPGELMLPVEPEEREILEAWLGEKRGHKVHFRIPKKGEKEKLVELAAKNAKMVLEKDKEAQIGLHFAVIDVDGAVSVPRYLKAERFADSAYPNHCAAIYGNRLQGRGLTPDNNLHLCLLTLCVRCRSNHHRLIVYRHCRCCYRTGYCQCHHHRNRLFHKNLPFIACVFLPFAIDTIENRKMLQPFQKFFLCLTQHFCYIKCI